MAVTLATYDWRVNGILDKGYIEYRDTLEELKVQEVTVSVWP